MISPMPLAAPPLPRLTSLGHDLDLSDHAFGWFRNSRPLLDDPNLPGMIEVTVSLKPVLCGTELDVTQAGIPDVIPLEMCYLGWQESLHLLSHVVDPEIPDGP